MKAGLAYDPSLPGALRDLYREDLPRVAELHCEAFPDSALTKLGNEAVRRYYEWQLTGPHDCQALGAFIDETLVGFCFGGIFRGALSGFLRAHRWFLMRRVMLRPYLLGDPFFRTRLVQGVAVWRRFAPRKTTPSPSKSKAALSFGILSIGVDPRCQGRGVGRTLMAAAEQEARHRGFEAMHLTVHPANTQAMRFYESLGWTRQQAEGVWKGRMGKTLRP